MLKIDKFRTLPSFDELSEWQVKELELTLEEQNSYDKYIKEIEQAQQKIIQQEAQKKKQKKNKRKQKKASRKKNRRKKK